MLIQCNLQNGRWHSYDNVKMQRALKIEICTISPAPIELLHTYRPPPLPLHTLQSWFLATLVALHWLSGWAEFQTSIASRIASLLKI